MIGYIKGEVLSAENGTVILLNNGIGFSVTCSAEAFNMLLQKGQGAVYTYMAVKEDDVSLYGFISLEEKKMFLQLISVSGVGPKMGIAILSGMGLSELALKIATSDVKGLSKVKGLGKKTAERIILELREKMGAFDAETGEIVTVKDVAKQEEENEDAVVALMSLGFTKAECVKALQSAKTEGAKTIQELISFALRSMR